MPEIWEHQINTGDLNESLPNIMFQICSNLQYILDDEDEIHNQDIETTNITITYKIQKKLKNKRNKLRFLGNYYKIKDNECNKTCSICLDNFEKGKYKRKMPNCTHEFHKKCIDSWLYKDKNFSCPICRTFQGSRQN